VQTVAEVVEGMIAEAALLVVEQTAVGNFAAVVGNFVAIVENFVVVVGIFAVVVEMFVVAA